MSSLDEQATVPVQAIALQGGARAAVLEPLVAALSGSSPDAGPRPPPVPAGRRRLVLVDGAEMNSDVAEEVSKALDADSGLVVLATSVLPFGLRGEHVVRIGPLGVPAARSRDAAAIGAAPAVQLFRARLAAADPGFEFDASRVEVAELCRRLDGHPLSLELAAARCATATVASVLEQLQRTSPLDVLKQGSRDVAARHRSLRETIEWSVRLLGDDERALLRRAAVFVGSFTWAALVEIAANGRDRMTADDTTIELTEQLDVLVATGMVRRVAGECIGEPDRYAIPAAVRAFVAEFGAEPSETAQLRRRHSSYYRNIARRAAARLWSAEHGRATRELVVEQQGLLQAFDDVSATGDATAALAFAVDLEALWIGIGATETAAPALAALHERACASNTGVTSTALSAEATTSMTALTLWSRNADLGPAHRARLRDARALARAAERPDLVLRTMVTELQTDILAGNVGEARATADEAIAIAEAVADDWWRMRFLSLSAAAANQAGNASLATAHAVAARDLARAIGDEHQLVLTSHLLTGIPGAARDPRVAVPTPDDLLAMARRLGDVQVEGMVLVATAVRYVMAAKFAIAAGHLRTALDVSARSGFWYLGELSLFVLVPTAVAAGRHAEAARLSGALHEAVAETRRRMPPGPVAAYDDALGAARTALGDGRFDRLAAAGRLLGWSEALAEADTLLASLIAAGGNGALPAPDGDRSYRLTTRELEVLRCIAGGASNKAIATDLGLRPKTVMHYAGAIYRKLGVSNRTEAVTVAWNAGLLAPPRSRHGETLE